MKIFFACPFSSRVDDDGCIFAEYRANLENLAMATKGAGHEYFLAPEYEGWKIAESEDAAMELANDFKTVLDSDMVIAYLEDRISAGVQLEMGCAQAKGKPIHIFQSGKPQWSNKTLSQIDGNSMTMVDSDEDFVTKAIEFIQSM